MNFETISKHPYRLCVHYANSGFDDPAGPRITCIAVLDKQTGQRHTFAPHRVILPTRGQVITEDEWDKAEREALSQFYRFVEQCPDVVFIHWNMKSSFFGFEAIADRFQVLGGQPVEIPQNSRFGLSNALWERYGDDYASHPRFESAIKNNGIGDAGFLPGGEEVTAWQENQHTIILGSVLRKAAAIRDLFDLAAADNFRTQNQPLQHHKRETPGRPSMMPAIQQEMKRRASSEELLPVLAQETRYLAQWAKEVFPGEQTPQPVSIGNRLNTLHRQLKKPH